MTVEDYLKRSMTLYPGLYLAITPEISRLCMLNQAFLTNGNGMDWYDGYLSDYDSKPKPYATAWLPNKKEKKKIVENKLKDIRQSSSRQRFTPYPLCQYACIANIPDNIRLDWLEAAIEVLNATEAFFKDPEQYVHDFYYPTDIAIRREEERLNPKPKTEAIDWNTEDGIKKLLERARKAKEEEKVNPYVPNPEIKAKLMRGWEEHVKEQFEYIEVARKRIAEIKSKR